MTSGRPSLVHQAAHLLAEGPAHTLELARHVLGLRGRPDAVSAAVFTLLGSDPRFLVDPDGTWRLHTRAAPLGPPLGGLDYAVVDVETVGGSYSASQRVIEVAVVHVNRGVIDRVFRTLVNPGRSIPESIFRLTGITDAMVAGAPFFDEIAEELLGRLEGRVFVAHNVRFDWSVLSGQLANAIGLVPDVERLCTVRMARKLLPGLGRQNLDALSAHFSVPILQRHRAYGDALATARILIRLLDEARAKGIHDLRALRNLLDGPRGEAARDLLEQPAPGRRPAS